jgi:carbon starvation protein CstA
MIVTTVMTVTRVMTITTVKTMTRVMSKTTKNNCDNDNDLAKMMIMTTKNDYVTMSSVTTVTALMTNKTDDSDNNFHCNNSDCHCHNRTIAMMSIAKITVVLSNVY